MVDDRVKALEILEGLPSKSINLNSFISLCENTGESSSSSSFAKPYALGPVIIEPYPNSFLDYFSYTDSV